MNKKYAIYLFGGVQQMADALGITRQAIYTWNNTLTQKQTDSVVGACSRLSIRIDESELSK